MEGNALCLPIYYKGITKGTDGQPDGRDAQGKVWEKVYRASMSNLGIFMYSDI
jgi:hypothetical protein